MELAMSCIDDLVDCLRNANTVKLWRAKCEIVVAIAPHDYSKDKSRRIVLGKSTSELVPCVLCIDDAGLGTQTIAVEDHPVPSMVISV
jgi:hypothetical protein